MGGWQIPPASAMTDPTPLGGPQGGGQGQPRGKGVFAARAKRPRGRRSLAHDDLDIDYARKFLKAWEQAIGTHGGWPSKRRGMKFGKAFYEKWARLKATRAGAYTISAFGVKKLVYLCELAGKDIRFREVGVVPVPGDIVRPKELAGFVIPDFTVGRAHAALRKPLGHGQQVLLNAQTRAKVLGEAYDKWLGGDEPPRYSAGELATLLL